MVEGFFVEGVRDGCVVDACQSQFFQLMQVFDGCGDYGEGLLFLIGHFLDRGNEFQAIQSVFVGASCKGKEIICTGIDGGVCLCHGEDEGDSGVNAALVQLLTENKGVFGKVQFYDDFRADFGKKL